MDSEEETLLENSEEETLLENRAVEKRGGLFSYDRSFLSLLAMIYLG